MNTTEQVQATQLTKFNRSIQVEVSLDAIAENLLSKMDKDFPHKELLVNTIIGQAVSNDRMQDVSRIYNSLNGYESKINFVKGQELFCTDYTHSYLFDPQGSRHMKGPCVVINVDPYKDHSKVEVSYKTMDRHGNIQETSSWVRVDELRERQESDVEQFDRAVEIALEDRGLKKAELPE